MNRLKFVGIFLVAFTFSLSAFGQNGADRFVKAETNRRSSSGLSRLEMTRALTNYANILEEAETIYGKNFVAERFVRTVEERIEDSVESSLQEIDIPSNEEANNLIKTAEISAQRTGDKDTIRALKAMTSDIRLADDPRSQAKTILHEVNASRIVVHLEDAIAKSDGSISRLLKKSLRSVQRYYSEVKMFDPFGLSRTLWAWGEDSNRHIFWRTLGVVFGTPFTLAFDFVVLPFLAAGCIWDGLVDVFTETEEEKNDRHRQDEKEWNEERVQLRDKIYELNKDIKELKNKLLDLGATDPAAGESGQYSK